LHEVEFNMPGEPQPENAGYAVVLVVARPDRGYAFYTSWGRFDDQGDVLKQDFGPLDPAATTFASAATEGAWTVQRALDAMVDGGRSWAT